MRDLRTKKKGIKCLKKNVVIKSTKNTAKPFQPAESINSKESVKPASNQELYLHHRRVDSPSQNNIEFFLSDVDDNITEDDLNKNHYAGQESQCFSDREIKQEHNGCKSTDTKTIHNDFLKDGQHKRFMINLSPPRFRLKSPYSPKRSKLSQNQMNKEKEKENGLSFNVNKMNIKVKKSSGADKATVKQQYSNCFSDNED